MGSPSCAGILIEVDGKVVGRKAIFRQFSVVFKGKEEEMSIAEFYPELEVEDAGFRTIDENERFFAKAMNQLHCDIASGLVALEGIKCQFDHGFEPFLCDKALNKQRKRLDKIRVGEMPGARLSSEDKEKERLFALHFLKRDAGVFEATRSDKEEQLIRQLGGTLSSGLPRSFNEYLRTGRLRLGEGSIVSVREGKAAILAMGGLRAFPLLFLRAAGERPRFEMVEPLAHLKLIVEEEARIQGAILEDVARDEAYGTRLGRLLRETGLKELEALAFRLRQEGRDANGTCLSHTEPETQRTIINPKLNLYEGINRGIMLCGNVLVSAEERRWLNGVPERAMRFKHILREVLQGHGYSPEQGSQRADEILGQAEVSTELERAVDRYLKSEGIRTNEESKEERYAH
jgi:hypothetical protein